MFKKILTLLMSLTLILIIAACGSGTTTIKVTNEDGSTQTVVLESLKTQLQNVTPITDYAANTTIYQMEYVTFGLDENSEPIEWIVLEKDGNKALLISKFILTKHQYNDEVGDITWENSTIRKWLNTEYINTIFSQKEQGSLLMMDILNNDNDAIYGSKGKGGNNTKDKLFLLSIDEVNKYFSSENQRKATYKGMYTYDIYNDWCLRSPGYSQEEISCISTFGTTSVFNFSADSYGVRPAMWVRY